MRGKKKIWLVVLSLVVAGLICSGLYFLDRKKKSEAKQEVKRMEQVEKKRKEEKKQREKKKQEEADRLWKEQEEAARKVEEDREARSNLTFGEEYNYERTELPPIEHRGIEASEPTINGRKYFFQFLREEEIEKIELHYGLWLKDNSDLRKESTVSEIKQESENVITFKLSFKNDDITKNYSTLRGRYERDIRIAYFEMVEDRSW